MLDQAEKYARAHRRRTRWHKVTTVMASIVVFGTTYALILPAITQERTTCGLVEHIHDDSCYREIPAVTRQELVCSEDSLNIHQHTKECYDEEKNLICGYADFIVHKHDDTCYDESGNLVCTLPEIEAHTHDNSCYAQPASAAHVHTEDCYTLQPVFLVCTETEGEGHIHTADCYTETTYLSCMFSDVEGHEHGPECYETVTELTCGQSEGGGHVHGEDCYVWDEVLTCEYADVTPEEPELICNKEEIVLHKHTKDCYDEDGNLICGKLEVLEHKHTEDCFQTVVVSEATRELICEKPEHTHDSSCYPETEKITETQTEELTGAATEAQTEKLTEAETEAETEELAEAESEAQTEELTEAESEAQTEELTEAESESESEEETELLTETESEELTEVESESETEEESETETEEADVLDEEFRLTAQAESGIEVTVSGPVTSLPYPVEEISLTAEEVTDEETIALWNQTLEEAGANAEEAFLLNITLWHDEEEIEPIGPVQVTFAGVETGDDELTVFHVDTENENTEDMNAVVDEEGAVVLDTDHFSVYGGIVTSGVITRKPQPGEYIYLDTTKVDQWKNGGWKLGFLYNGSGGTRIQITEELQSNLLYRIKLPSDMDTSKGINFFRYQSDSITDDNNVDWISKAIYLTPGTNLFAMSGYWDGNWVGNTWYTESLKGKTMYFENKGTNTVSEVKAVFYESASESAEKETVTGTYDGSKKAWSFTIPNDYTYVRFVDGSGNTLGDPYSNFYGMGQGEDGVESFQYDASSKCSYKYKNTAADSTWGSLGDGKGINGHDSSKYLNTIASGGTFYLEESVGWDSTITITKDVTLDLRGNTITTNANVLFNVTNGATLTIIDSSTNITEDTPTTVTGTTATSSTDGSISDYKLTYYVTEAVPNGTTTDDTRYKHTVDFSSCGKIVHTGSGSVIAVQGGTLNVDGGVIKGNGSHVIDMYGDKSGNTVNLSDGLIWGKDGSGDHGAGIYVGAGNLNISGGYIAGGGAGGDYRGGGIYLNSGTINMSDGVVAANHANEGGGIYMNAGTLNLSGGYIASNKTNSGADNDGGGIFAAANSVINMTGGYITNNRKPDGTAGRNSVHGGGGVTLSSATMFMSGGYVTGNYSGEAGGGIYAGYWDHGCKFTMTGGTISSNTAQNAEGGGLRVSMNSNAVIDASAGGRIYITHNNTYTMNDWGGGGIFVQEGGNLNILEALVTNNTAKGFGGGVGSCPSGDVQVATVGGAAIFDNHAQHNAYVPSTNIKPHDSYFAWYYWDVTRKDAGLTPMAGFEDEDCQDYFGIKQRQISNEMPGGGSENWSIVPASEPATPHAASDTTYAYKIEKEYLATNGGVIDANKNDDVYVLPLTAYPSAADKLKAERATYVYISDNYSETHGGGIMTNGNLDIGKTDRLDKPEGLIIKATKEVLLTDSNTTKTTGLPQFEFVLMKSKPAWNAQSREYTVKDPDVVQGKYNEANGTIEFGSINFRQEGAYTYYLVEKPANDGYIHDPVLYEIDVTVQDEVTSTTTTHKIKQIDLWKYEEGGEPEKLKTITQTEIYSMPTDTKSGSHILEILKVEDTEEPKNNKVAFTNKYYTLPSTGGHGTTLYTLGGLLMIAVAEFFLLYNYKKRRKEDGASS